MVHSFEFFTMIFKTIFENQLEIRWSLTHMLIIDHYFEYLSTTCDLGGLHSELFIDTLWIKLGSSAVSAKIPVSLAQELQPVFMVPRLNKFHQSQSRIKKYQLVEAFIGFLHQLLYHKADSTIDSYRDRTCNLEKELRFLLTFLGDAPLMLCADEHEEFQKLLAEFEAVANEAGHFVYSLFFSVDTQAFGKMDKVISVVLNHIHLLKANIMKFLDTLSSIRRANYSTPETSVLDSLLVIDSLIYDLEDLMDREDNPVADAKDQIKRLHQGLIVLQSSIEPSKREELKQPLIRIGEMAHEAEYLIVSFLVGDAPFWYLINRLTDVNHKIELVRTELQQITKTYESGDLLKFPRHFATQKSLQVPRNSEVDDATVGFEGKATDILEQLVGGETDRLQVISIFGMPGLGKTTLAKKLYNHPFVNNWFDRLSWCVVSQTYLRRSLLATILTQIARELSKDNILKMEEESLAEHVYKTLKGRRYLIVLDDMWDSDVWDKLLRYFPDDGKGSRILFTTRNNNVAPPKSIPFALPCLTNDQCWELLEKKVFENKPCPHELLQIGKQIAANCCGLPLAVVVIAGILLTMDKEVCTWEEVGENLASYIFDGGDNSVMQILELSYKHLPVELKLCFLYFGAFPKDKEISVGELMRLWISEGFIRKEKEKKAENLAEELLMELIDKSLVMVAKRRSDGGVKTCVIHDLLHDLCLKIVEEESFLKFVQSEHRAMYNKGDCLQSLQCSVTWSYCQYMRSLYGSILMIPLHVRDMRLLRALHFDSSSIFITGIEFLACLRYLIISDLPPSIGSLINLEYLRVETDEEVILSSEIMKMKKLRYISVSSKARYGKDCNSSQTNNLEFLSRVAIEELKDEEMLKCSPHLRKLKCDCLKEVYGSFDLSFLTQLESLDLRFSESQFLDRISLPSHIKKLTLCGLGPKLHWECVSMIGRLENLEVLKLIGIDFEGRWDTRDGEFEKLRYLKLQDMDLFEWNVESSQHFPKLQQLVLRRCFLLQEIPSEIGEIPTLQLIEVEGECLKSLAVSAKIIQQEQLDMGNEELRTIVSSAFWLSSDGYLQWGWQLVKKQ